MTDTPPPIVTRQSLVHGGSHPGVLWQLGQAVSALLWMGVLLACLIAALSFFSATGAPQQAAAAAMAVIPYCFARAWDGMRRA